MLTYMLNLAPRLAFLGVLLLLYKTHTRELKKYLAFVVIGGYTVGVLGPAECDQ